MKTFLGTAALCLALAVPFAALADEEQVPTDKEVMQAEGMPPLMPHAAPRMKGLSEEAACLTCHEAGKSGAPQTPHPERRACTQCHVQGEVKAKAAKGRKKK
jgi:nitrate reductase cytochrome c-type subunit